jgi:hypothetical protein
VNADSQKSKCIIYCRRLGDGEFAALHLSLPFYHSKCVTREEKEKMIGDFAKTGTDIVATNLLGLGFRYSLCITGAVTFFHEKTYNSSYTHSMQ